MLTRIMEGVKPTSTQVRDQVHYHFVYYSRYLKLLGLHFSHQMIHESVFYFLIFLNTIQIFHEYLSRRFAHKL